MRRSLRSAFARLRVRLAVFLVLGTIVAVSGTYVTLLRLTREWIDREQTARNISLVREVAREASLPMVTGDIDKVAEEMQLEMREDDIVGFALFDGRGLRLRTTIARPTLWREGVWSAPNPAEPPELRRDAHPLRRFELRSYLVPIPRHARGVNREPDEDERILGPALSPEAVTTGAPVGYLRLVVSTARLERTMALAGQVGVALVLVALVVAMIGAWSLVRLVTRPLKEASALARAIANGQLDRRLPVRSDDEIGTLAESMNTMAGALAESRRRELDEAATLRDTAEAMVAVGQSARDSNDPVRVFHVVAEQVRRVTRCPAVALAVADPDRGGLAFEHFDPPAPWGGFQHGTVMDAELAGRFQGPTPPLVRLGLLSPTDALSRSLARAGYRSALLVPLAVADGPTAALLLVSERTEAFDPSDVRVVTGLSSHLTAALHTHELSTRLEQAFEELQATQDQLVRAEKLRATGELASGIAHDFNNVLGAILGRLQLLRRELARGRIDPSGLADSLATMELAAHDGAETVRRLRQFSVGDSPMNAGPIDLAATMSAAADFTRPRWKDEAESDGRLIRLELRCEPGISVSGRASELREVFTNLILNAVDALPHGGSILLSGRASGDHAIAVVEDDGVGMSSEVLSRIFDPFFTTKGARGTGLGLSVVYGIVQRMAGRLEVVSDPGDGTRIEMRFPLCAEAAAEDLAPPATAPQAMPLAAASGLRVLVVDDDEEVRRLLGDICTALGHNSAICASGADALREYQVGRFHLVLTDLGMPGMSGWELVHALREQDREVMIALVTGWGDAVDAEMMQKAGADAVISKPFTIEDLARVIALAGGDRRAA